MHLIFWGRNFLDASFTKFDSVIFFDSWSWTLFLGHFVICDINDNTILTVLLLKYYYCVKTNHCELLVIALLYYWFLNVSVMSICQSFVFDCEIIKWKVLHYCVVFITTYKYFFNINLSPTIYKSSSMRISRELLYVFSDLLNSVCRWHPPNCQEKQWLHGSEHPSETKRFLALALLCHVKK